MGSIAVTGAGGFLGWHTRVRAKAHPVGSVVATPLGELVPLATIATALSGRDRVIHLAGVNCGDAHEVRCRNVELATQLADGLRLASTPPRLVMYANSIQAGNGTCYGDGKAEAGEVLAVAAAEVGAEFVDLRLPNLFGEHGRPFYNSVVATFSHLMANGRAPVINEDRELALLHVQDAADLLLRALPGQSLNFPVRNRTVTSVLQDLTRFSTIYQTGEMPELANEFDIALFNTYRSFTFPVRWRLTRRSDGRGSFVETVRAHRSPGQTSFSCTVPGVTRGQHFHLGKIERFVVLSGRAEIALRRLFTDDIVRFSVSGDEPVAIDMPTMWAHNITNTGGGDLYTLFWTNELFDPAAPDTFPEDV